MGSLITLGIGRLEVDWGKNSVFQNHSKLFKPEDIHPITYYYAENHQKKKSGFMRKLQSVVKRLELLGYTLSECRELYGEAVRQIPDYYPGPAISFDVLAQVLESVDVNRVALPDEPEHYDLGEYVARNILADPEFTKTAAELKSLTADDGTFFENLDPYLVLRLLARNPANLDLDVAWRFADVVEGGWVEQSELYQGLSEADRYLIVTEGSSDSATLRETLSLVDADVADFFDFIDMSENYPFTGTGNLVRFCQGLARIRIQNRVIVVLDNDVAGREAYRRIRSLDLPRQMRVALLPHLDEATRFRTLGPAGESFEDINRRAVSIECFLDLRYGTEGEPTVRWTSYSDTLNAYQGELIGKEAYVRAFLEKGRVDKGYNLSKLRYLWSHILNCCATPSTY